MLPRVGGRGPSNGVLPGRPPGLGQSRLRALVRLPPGLGHLWLRVFPGGWRWWAPHRSPGRSGCGPEQARKTGPRATIRPTMMMRLNVNIVRRAGLIAGLIAVAFLMLSDRFDTLTSPIIHSKTQAASAPFSRFSVVASTLGPDNWVAIQGARSCWGKHGQTQGPGNHSHRRGPTALDAPTAAGWPRKALRWWWRTWT